jgi:hypothetical protein
MQEPSAPLDLDRAEARLDEEIGRLKRRFAALEAVVQESQAARPESGAFVIAATSREEMNEKELADELDRILSERLREAPDKSPNGPWEAPRLAVRWIRQHLGGKPDVRPNTPWQWQIIARIRSLPAHMQDPLRRYFVFREAEESICSSMNIAPVEFRRFLREATDYILMRRERMPELETKNTQ